ncbi:unnamed protein product, partial [Ranitomeya imitator]
VVTCQIAPVFAGQAGGLFSIAYRQKTLLKDSSLSTENLAEGLRETTEQTFPYLRILPKEA